MSEKPSAVRIVNMGEEMFNDALYFVEQARMSTANPYSLWRNCRAAILYFCMSAESDLSKLIVLSLKRHSELNAEQEDILDFLINSSRVSGAIPEKLKTIKKKYKYLCKINGVNKTNLPTEYEKLTSLRNMITHYSFSQNESVYSQTILEDTERALPIIQDFIAHIWDVANLRTPTWISHESYRELKDN